MALANEFDQIRDIQELTRLMRENKMKEFYALANKVLRIKRSHPVVTKVSKTNDKGDVEAYDDKSQAE